MDFAFLDDRNLAREGRRAVKLLKAAAHYRKTGNRLAHVLALSEASWRARDVLRGRASHLEYLALAAINADLANHENCLWVRYEPSQTISGRTDVVAYRDAACTKEVARWRPRGKYRTNTRPTRKDALIAFNRANWRAVWL